MDTTEDLDQPPFPPPGGSEYKAVAFDTIWAF